MCGRVNDAITQAGGLLGGNARDDAFIERICFGSCRRRFSRALVAARGVVWGADDNWLAKSLSLPALGQTHSNAAMSVIGGNKESAWGWLADEVSWREESDMTREEMMRAEAEVLNVGGAQNVALENMPNPFAGLGSDGAAKGAEEGTTVQRVTAAARPAEGDAAKVSVPPAGVGGAPGPAAPILRPEATARPELSQTRKAIAEMTGG